MLHLLILFSVLIQIHAVIEWPFMHKRYETLVNLTIGTPGQPLTVNIDFDNVDFGKTIAGLFINEKGNFEGFEMNNSTTFKRVKEYKDLHEETIGFRALEDFTITTKSAKNITLKQLPVKVHVNARSQYLHHESLSFIRSNDGDTFIEQLLKREKERVVVVTFDSVPTNRSEDYTGLLTLGGRPDYCTNWTYVPESTAENGEQWNFVVDSYKVGNFTYSKPLNASFNFEPSAFKIPTVLYKKTIAELNTDEYDELKCQQTKKIVFTVGGKELELSPEDYIKDEEFNDYDDKSEICRFGAYARKGLFVDLPLELLRNQCILFDFKLKRIGLADKLIQTI